jgi:hypothetical protein
MIPGTFVNQPDILEFEKGGEQRSYLVWALYELTLIGLCTTGHFIYK